MEIAPWDEHNRALAAHAHPEDWQNPQPAPRYNLVAVGGGTAGLVAAVITAGLGGRVAMIERQLLGGDCLNLGCVPSKSLLAAARAIYQATRGAAFGFSTPAGVRVDFAAVMERMRRLRAQIAAHDSAERFRSLGVDVFLGDAKFTGPRTVNVAGCTLAFRRAIVATGGRAAVPDIAGLADAGYLTNETIFSLVHLPRRLVVLGGGPVGCELAQAFRRFGSEVHVIERGERILHKEDPAAAEVVQAQLAREGVHFHLGWQTVLVERTGNFKCLSIERHGERQKLFADAVLVAVGRRPNVEGLGLDAAGVAYNDQGVEVNDRLQTTNRAIYAAGDVCTRFRFTHAADAMARICVQNALFLGRRRASALVIPRTTYTDPELAHVGLTPAEAVAAGIAIDSHRVDLAAVDRAIVEGDEQGFAVIHTRRGKGRIVGATIVARNAGDIIAEVTLAMTARLPLSAIGRTIHCYPTQVDVLKRIADNYSRTRLTPRVAKVLSRWLAWRR